MDPNYVVRAVQANEYDCNLCAKLAERAVHCAFAGFTNFSVGMINNKPCMIPLDKMCGKAERKVEFNSDDYLMLLASTGQPSFYPQETSDDEYDDLKKKEKESGKKEPKKSIDSVNSESDDKEEKKEGKIFSFN